MEADADELGRIIPANDPSLVRCCVAKNKNTPEETLIKLSEDPSVVVRCCVAKNPNTPVHVLQRLAEFGL